MNTTERPLSPFWARVLNEARRASRDWGMGSDQANFAASLIAVANRSWKGDASHFGPAMLARLMGCEIREAIAAFQELQAADYVEVVERGSLAEKTSTQIRWTGPPA